jgi:hypothetical protein
MAKDQDPKQAIQQTKKVVSGGIVGWLTKLFLGKNFVDETNDILEASEAQIDLVGKQQRLITEGTPAKAKVSLVQDTGSLVNFDPIIMLSLHVESESGEKFDISTTHVSKLSIPKVGETINIKYDSNDKSSIVIV